MTTYVPKKDAFQKKPKTQIFENFQNISSKTPKN